VAVLLALVWRSRAEMTLQGQCRPKWRAKRRGKRPTIKGQGCTTKGTESATISLPWPIAGPSVAVIHSTGHL